MNDEQPWYDYPHSKKCKCGHTFGDHVGGRPHECAECEECKAFDPVKKKANEKQ